MRFLVDVQVEEGLFGRGGQRHEQVLAHRLAADGNQAVQALAADERLGEECADVRQMNGSVQVAGPLAPPMLPPLRDRAEPDRASKVFSMRSSSGRPLLMATMSPSPRTRQSVNVTWDGDCIGIVSLSAALLTSRKARTLWETPLSPFQCENAVLEGTLPAAGLRDHRLGLAFDIVGIQQELEIFETQVPGERLANERCCAAFARRYQHRVIRLGWIGIRLENQTFDGLVDNDPFDEHVAAGLAMLDVEHAVLDVLEERQRRCQAWIDAGRWTHLVGVGVDYFFIGLEDDGRRRFGGLSRGRQRPEIFLKPPRHIRRCRPPWDRSGPLSSPDLSGTLCWAGR